MIPFGINQWDNFTSTRYIKRKVCTQKGSVKYIFQGIFILMGLISSVRTKDISHTQFSSKKIWLLTLLRYSYHKKCGQATVCEIF